MRNALTMHDGSHTQIKDEATYLTMFGAHINILSIIKVKILVLTKWSYRSPPNYFDH